MNCENWETKNFQEILLKSENLQKGKSEVRSFTEMRKLRNEKLQEFLLKNENLQNKTL